MDGGEDIFDEVLDDGEAFFEAYFDDGEDIFEEIFDDSEDIFEKVFWWYLVIKAKEVRIVKEVIRSDGLWRFACGDVF